MRTTPEQAIHDLRMALYLERQHLEGLDLGVDSGQRDRRVAGLTAAMEELKGLEGRLGRSWD